MKLVRREKEAEDTKVKVYRLRDNTTGLFWRGYSGFYGGSKWHKVGKLYTRLSDLTNSLGCYTKNNKSGHESVSRTKTFVGENYSLITYELTMVEEEQVDLV